MHMSRFSLMHRSDRRDLRGAGQLAAAGHRDGWFLQLHVSPWAKTEEPVTHLVAELIHSPSPSPYQATPL